MPPDEQPFPEGEFLPPAPPASDAPAGERYAIEARAQEVRTVAVTGEWRRGDSDRIEVGDADEVQSTDIVIGAERTRIHGSLTETVHGSRTNVAKRHETRINGNYKVDCHSDTELVGGGVAETHLGAELLIAGMSDDLIIGAGLRATAGLDVWLCGLIGMEEKPVTCAADGVFAEISGLHVEREYITGTHSASFALFSGSVYTTTATGFRPLIRALKGVRNTTPGGGGGGGGAGGGSAPPTPPPPPHPPSGTMLKATIRGSQLLDAAGDLGRAMDAAADVARVADESADTRSAMNLGEVLEDLSDLSNAVANGDEAETAAALRRLEDSTGIEDLGSGDTILVQRDGVVRVEATNNAQWDDPNWLDIFNDDPAPPRGDPDAPPTIRTDAGPPPNYAAPNLDDPSDFQDIWDDLLYRRQQQDIRFQGAVEETGAKPGGLHLAGYDDLQITRVNIRNQMAELLAPYLEDLGLTLDDVAKMDNHSRGGPRVFELREHYLRAMQLVEQAGDLDKLEAMRGTLAGFEKFAAGQIEDAINSANWLSNFDGVRLPSHIDQAKLQAYLGDLAQNAVARMFGDDISDEARQLASLEATAYQRAAEQIAEGFDPTPYILEQQRRLVLFGGDGGVRSQEGVDLYDAVRLAIVDAMGDQAYFNGPPAVLDDTELARLTNLRNDYFHAGKFDLALGVQDDLDELAKARSWTEDPTGVRVRGGYGETAAGPGQPGPSWPRSRAPVEIEGGYAALDGHSQADDMAVFPGKVNPDGTVLQFEGGVLRLDFVDDPVPARIVADPVDLNGAPGRFGSDGGLLDEAGHGSVFMDSLQPGRFSVDPPTRSLDLLTESPDYTRQLGINPGQIAIEDLADAEDAGTAVPYRYPGSEGHYENFEVIAKGPPAADGLDAPPPAVAGWAEPETRGTATPLLDADGARWGEPDGHTYAILEDPDHTYANMGDLQGIDPANLEDAPGNTYANLGQPQDPVDPQTHTYSSIGDVDGDGVDDAGIYSEINPDRRTGFGRRQPGRTGRRPLVQEGLSEALPGQFGPMSADEVLIVDGVVITHRNAPVRLENGLPVIRVAPETFDSVEQGILNFNLYDANYNLMPPGSYILRADEALGPSVPQVSLTAEELRQMEEWVRNRRQQRVSDWANALDVGDASTSAADVRAILDGTPDGHRVADLPPLPPDRPRLPTPDEFGFEEAVAKYHGPSPNQGGVGLDAADVVNPVGEAAILSGRVEPVDVPPGAIDADISPVLANLEPEAGSAGLIVEEDLYAVVRKGGGDGSAVSPGAGDGLLDAAEEPPPLPPPLAPADMVDNIPTVEDLMEDFHIWFDDALASSGADDAEDIYARLEDLTMFDDPVPSPALYDQIDDPSLFLDPESAEAALRQFQARSGQTEVPADWNLGSAWLAMKNQMTIDSGTTYYDAHRALAVADAELKEFAANFAPLLEAYMTPEAYARLNKESVVSVRAALVKVMKSTTDADDLAVQTSLLASFDQLSYRIISDATAAADLLRTRPDRVPLVEGADTAYILSNLEERLALEKRRLREAMRKRALPSESWTVRIGGGGFWDFMKPNSQRANAFTYDVGRVASDGDILALQDNIELLELAIEEVRAGFNPTAAIDEYMRNARLRFDAGDLDHGRSRLAEMGQLRYELVDVDSPHSRFVGNNGQVGWRLDYNMYTFSQNNPDRFEENLFTMGNDRMGWRNPDDVS